MKDRTETDRSHQPPSRRPPYDREKVIQEMGSTSIRKVQGDLRSTGLLRTVSWQAIAESLAGEAALEWMAEGLAAKYGFLVGRPRPPGGLP
jgi:hypothetical protein